MFLIRHSNFANIFPLFIQQNARGCHLNFCLENKFDGNFFFKFKSKNKESEICEAGA